jgi:hypothetical protein
VISHVKSSWHHIIPFLPFLQLPIPRLLSTLIVYVALLCLLLLLLSCRTFLITTLHGPCTKRTCHVIATQPVHWRADCCLAMVVARTCRKRHVTTTLCYGMMSLCMRKLHGYKENTAAVLLAACVLQAFLSNGFICYSSILGKLYQLCHMNSKYWY